MKILKPDAIAAENAIEIGKRIVGFTHPLYNNVNNKLRAVSRL
jgi:hypothetical protein